MWKLETKVKVGRGLKFCWIIDENISRWAKWIESDWGEIEQESKLWREILFSKRMYLFFLQVCSRVSTILEILDYQKAYQTT